MRYHNFFIIFLILLAYGPHSATFAATISYSTNWGVNTGFSLNSNTAPSAERNLSVSRTLNRFDTTLGTLTGVNFYINYTSSIQQSSYSYDNIGESSSFNDTSHTSTSSFLQEVYLGDPAQRFLDSWGDSVTTGCNATSNVGGYVTCSSQNTSNNGTNKTPTLPTNIPLTYYEGVDPLAFTLRNRLLANLICDGGDSGDFCSVTSNFGWNTILTISYTYDESVAAVPVPAAIWLMGSGLLGLIGFSRQKKTQSVAA